MTAQLVLHGDRAGGRPAGSPTVLPLPAPDLFSNEPTVPVAKLARLALLSGAWRTAPKTGGIDAKGDYVLSLRTPAALLFPAAARHALLRRPPARGCHWCVARFLSALDGRPEPTPSDPLLAFLGRPCGACQQRHAISARVAEVRAEFAAEVASGRWQPRRPPPSRPVRPPRGRQGAPGAMRASGQPPPPPYYRRRPWPPEMDELREQAARMHQQARQRRAAARVRP